MIYRVGLAGRDVERVALERSGLKFKIVEPRNQFVASVKSVLGKPYKWGASVLKDATEAFDCSSLVAWAGVEAGLAIPRICIDQFVFSKKITKEELKEGDLIFSNTGITLHTKDTHFSKVLGKVVQDAGIRTESVEFMPGTKVPGGVDHVGVYLGEGRIIHASGETKSVVEEDLASSNWFKNIVGYGCIIDDEGERFVVEIPDNRPDLRNQENLIKEVNK